MRKITKVLEGGNYRCESLSATVEHENIDRIESKEDREKEFEERPYSDHKKNSSISTYCGSHDTTMAQSEFDQKEAPISPISSDYPILLWPKSSDIDEDHAVDRDQPVNEDSSEVEDEDGYLLKP